MSDRLCPETPLPAYAHVPDRTPHPRSHPQGHRFGVDLPDEPAFRLDGWAESLRYRLGIDLINSAFFWEAHEVWEGLWCTLADGGRDQAKSAERAFVKGLIQWAVAGVKIAEQKPESAEWHARRGLVLFSESAAALTDRLGGFSVQELIRRGDRWAETLASGCWPGDFQLHPAATPNQSVDFPKSHPP